jgi:FkbM family methyltransferase
MRTPLRSNRVAQFLYHALYRAVAPTAIQVVEAPGGRLLVDSKDEGVGMFLLTEGVFEPEETLLFRELARRSQVILDIGANIGYFTLLAARYVPEGGRVVAVEPDRRNADLLSESVALNGYVNVDIERIAIGDASGSATIFRDRRNRGGTSLFASNIAEPLGSDVVPMTTVDQLVEEKSLERVDLIKIDVQGAEGLVLEGARTTLERWHPTVVFEYWPTGLSASGRSESQPLALLQGRGYVVAIVGVNSAAPAADDEVADACAGGRGFVTLVAEYQTRRMSGLDSGLLPRLRRR